MLSTAMLFAPNISDAQVTGDINGDGRVNIQDVTLAASQYMLESSDSGYNATIVGKADLAEPFDGRINILDLATLISYYTG